MSLCETPASRPALTAWRCAIWLAALILVSWASTASGCRPISDVWLSDLPAEARATVVLIHADGPFPYRRDGITFGNRERCLPPSKYGYYREYTVPTPGARPRRTAHRCRGQRRVLLHGRPLPQLPAHPRMTSLDDLLSSLTLSGPCATRQPARALAAAAGSKGYGVYTVDLAGITDKAALMECLQVALHFPEWFGRNWDALEDCLTDMSWSEHVGYVLLMRGGAQLRRDQKPLFDTLIDVLKSAADYWRGQERPFWAFFLDVQPDPALPSFP